MSRPIGAALTTIFNARRDVRLFQLTRLYAENRRSEFASYFAYNQTKYTVWISVKNVKRSIARSDGSQKDGT